MSISSKIQNLRLSRGYSQLELANMLKVSRQTYIKMEADESSLSIEQLFTIAAIYGVDVNELLYEPSNNDKFKQMYLYFVSKFKNGVPKTKLAKLLYLADFRHFYENLESMSGTLYKCRKYGPLSDSFLQLTDEMVEAGTISIEYLEGGTNLIKNQSYNLAFNLLSENEIKELDEIYELWKDIKSEVIVNYTHEQKPWMSCRENEIIPYELILQEDPNHVYTPIK